MFWRKRKAEGFVWKEHVRTTIALRREARAEQIAALKDAAERQRDAAVGAARDGVDKAGRAIAREARRSADRIGSSMADGAVRAQAAVKDGYSSLRRAVPAAGSAAAGAIGPALARVRRLRPPPLPNAVQARIERIAEPLAKRREIADLAGLAGTISLVSGAAGMITQTGTLVPYVLIAAGLVLIATSAAAAVARGAARVPALPTVSLATVGAVTGAIGVIGFTFWAAPWQHLGLTQPESTPLITGTIQRSSPRPDPESLVGRARPETGDSIVIAGSRVRLVGIAAPESAQICRNARGRRWLCGRDARRELAKLVRGRTVACTIDGAASGPAEDATLRGRCEIDGADLGRMLVQGGHVFAETGWFAPYADEEAAAKARGAGIWAGETERPEDFRKARWSEAEAAAPDGCPIKGRIDRGERTYVLPWSTDYRRVRIRESRGERWFCDEDAAIAAGWRPAG